MIRRHSAGFSLAELLIAMAILGFGLLVIGAALPIGLRYTRETTELAQGEAATQYGMQVIESWIRRSLGVDRDGFIRPRVVRAAVDTPSDTDVNTMNKRGQFDQKAIAGQLLDRASPRREIQVSMPESMELYRRLAFESRVKVLPFIVRQVDRTIDSGELETKATYSTSKKPPKKDGPFFDSEHLYDQLSTWWPLSGNPKFDWSIGGAGDITARTALLFDTRWMPPALSSSQLVYPPVSLARSKDLTPTYFFTQSNTDRLELSQSDVDKMVSDRQVVWTAFYRPILSRATGWSSVADPNDSLQPTKFIGRTGDERRESGWYEVIVVACRLPSKAHRFPVQDPQLSFGDGGNQRQYTPARTTLAPTPWLVEFDELPLLEGGKPDPADSSVDYVEQDLDDPATWDRPLKATFSEQRTLTFKVSEENSPLFRVGSIFIPALNDDVPVGLNRPWSKTRHAHIAGQKQYYDPQGDPRYFGFWQERMNNRASGFVPHSPDSTPIYEVIERPDEKTVVVKSNGYYPWVNLSRISKNVATQYWPVWVLPPTIEAEGDDGEPVFDRKSPILAVTRRVMQFRETD